MKVSWQILYTNFSSCYS